VLVAHLSFAVAIEDLYIALIPDWRYAIPQRIYDGFIGGLRELAFSALIADMLRGKPSLQCLV